MRLFPPGLLPVRRRLGPGCWVFAGLCAASMLGAALAWALPPAQDGGARLIVQVAGADADRRQATVAAALAALGASRAAREVRRLGDGEVARLIEPYVGGVDAADLPLPALIEARVTPGAEAEALRRRLEALGASVTGARAAPPLAARRWIAAGIALAGVGGTALAALIAARGAVAAERATTALLRELGANDAQLARTLADPLVRGAVAGGAIGAAAALPLIALGSHAMAATDPAAGLRWTGWLGLALLAAALVALARGTIGLVLRVLLGRAA